MARRVLAIGLAFPMGLKYRFVAIRASVVSHRRRRNPSAHFLTHLRRLRARQDRRVGVYTLSGTQAERRQ